MPPKYTIIIPYRTWSEDLDECLTHLANTEHNFWHAILLPDHLETIPDRFCDLPITVIPTGAIGPGIKRDIGAAKATSTYLAFIDDDAYPRADWLEQADSFFSENPDWAALGGPATTPQSDPYWARVSGSVFLSRVGGGFPERYIPVPPAKEIDDWPSVNLIVRKSVFDEVGGFDSNYWPGEDTKLCRDIIQAGHKIYYLPSMQVYHHRRATLRTHMRQIGNYGYHRGIFARLYPETSRKPVFFIPTLFVLFVILSFGTLSLYPDLKPLFTVGYTFYALALLKAIYDISKYEPFHIAMAAVPYIILTHIWYGLNFVRGLIKKQYRVSLGR